MKSYLLLFFSFGAIPLNAQWSQSQLGDAQYGYNLYSSDSEVFAATLNGVYSTTDNGNPWFNMDLQNKLVFDVIKSGQFILAATEGIGPGVYRTSDNGNNWLNAIGIENRSVRAFTKNSSYLFACTWDGGIFRSSDDGGTWESVGDTNVGFRSIYALGEKIFVGGDKIYFSNNNGDSWEMRQLPYPAGDTWCFNYTNGILYAGDMGLYFSTDLGNTWALKYGVTFDNQGNAVDGKIIKDIVAYQNVLIASIAFNGILISYDDGSSWVDFNNGLMTDWTFSALAINHPYIWTLRDFMGNAYYCSLSNLTDVESRNSEYPMNYLLKQNYPNPFNPTTQIRFGIPEAGSVTLKIYNSVGQLVKTLVDGNMSEGYHQVTWNATDNSGSKLSSGVYFYRITAGTFTQVNKMMLLK